MSARPECERNAINRVKKEGRIVVVKGSPADTICRGLVAENVLREREQQRMMGETYIAYEKARNDRA